jgi:hypothetical protein
VPDRRTGTIPVEDRRANRREGPAMAKKRHQRPCWYDMGQVLKLLLGLTDGIVELIRIICGG